MRLYSESSSSPPIPETVPKAVTCAPELEHVRPVITMAPVQETVDRRADGDQDRQIIRCMEEREVAQIWGAIRELRYQLQSESSTFIRKIPNFYRKLEEALLHGDAVYKSEPFYSGRFGYKLCTELHPNPDSTTRGHHQGVVRDDVARGSHLSIYLIVMKSDNDALLPWPFRQKVTMTLMDGYSDVTEEITPDPCMHNECFRRPEEDTNPPFIIPKFCTFCDARDFSSDLMLKIVVAPYSI